MSVTMHQLAPEGHPVLKNWHAGLTAKQLILAGIPFTMQFDGTQRATFSIAKEDEERFVSAHLATAKDLGLE